MLGTTLEISNALPVPLLRQVSLFRALQERPEALKALPGVVWLVSETILGAF